MHVVGQAKQEELGADEDFSGAQKTTCNCDEPQVDLSWNPKTPALTIWVARRLTY